MKKLFIVTVIGIVLLSACTPNKPSYYRGLPQQYTTA